MNKYDVIKDLYIIDDYPITNEYFLQDNSFEYENNNGQIKFGDLWRQQTYNRKNILESKYKSTTSIMYWDLYFVGHIADGQSLHRIV